MPTLGQSLSQTISELTDLIDALDDGPQRDDLLKKQKALAKQLQHLIDDTVPTDTERYRTATAAVEKANASLVAARADVQKVAQTIDQIAEVIGVIGELAANLK